VNRALRAAAMGVLLLSPIALSACSAGQVSQTAAENRDKVGGLANVGDIAIRQAQLAYPVGGSYAAGGDARLLAAIVNTGADPDTLVSITGDEIGGAEVTAAGTPTTAAPTTTTAAPTTPTTTAAPTAGAPTTAPAPTTPAPTTAAPTTAPGSGPLNVPIPGNTNVYIGGSGPTITLTGLSRTVTPGDTIEVTMTFQRAGDVPVQLVVATPPRDIPRGEPFDFEQTSPPARQGA
jgi:copper(I)-binding protein